MPKNGAAQTQANDSPNNLNGEIEALRQEFQTSHGENIFTDYYIGIFNKKPSMHADTFNRSAQPFLVGLFLSVVLEKSRELQDMLIDGFIAEAKRPWAGQSEELTPDMIDQILYDLQDAADKLAYAKAGPV